MPQEPLTSAGIQQKQSDLYALSNSALLVEANAIRSDFKSWLTTNFIFNTAQETYLNGMDARWIEYAAHETGLAVENRLPITFTAPNPLPPPTISKMIEMEGKTIKAMYSQSGGFVVTGELGFTISP